MAAQFERKIPDGDNRERRVCGDCGFVDYENPRVIVGAVCSWQDRILICKRAIEPRRGFWTLPAGFMEVGETMQQGAAREAWEEARAKLLFDGVLGIYDVLHSRQVHVMFRARLASPEVAPGPESTDVLLVEWDAIPWESLAFPSVRWALEHYRESLGRPLGAPFASPAGESGRW